MVLFIAATSSPLRAVRYGGQALGYHRRVMANRFGLAILLCRLDARQRRSAEPAAKPPVWKQPMTPWGEPDLRGMWPLNHLISTPFQRPERFGERRLLTDEEFAAAQKSAEDRNTRFQSGAIPQADAGQATRQTSLMVDPPNGRFPALTPKGKELYDQMRGSYKPGQTVFDTPDDFDSWDRCITRGLPVSMLPRNYNNGIRIMQFPGYVVILLEMAHEARIIPTTTRPALDGAIRQYLGESRGRWEGNTLVVETTNFNGKTAMTNLGVPGSPALTPSTREPALHRALHAHRQRHHRLSDDGRGSGGADDGEVVGGVSAEAR